MRKLYAVLALVATIIGSALAFGDGLNVPFSMPVTTCTSQFVRSIAAITGAGTCATVANADLASMSAATIKGQIVAGSGAPVDMTATQAAAVIGSVGGVLKTKLITITRDLTVATGSVAYTGMGFQPTACLATGEVGASIAAYVNIFSMADSNRTAAAAYINASAIANVANFVALGDATGANNQKADISSYDSDGLTLSWVKTGTPTGTATINIMCAR